MSRNILLIQENAAEATVVRDGLKSCCDDTFEVEWVRSCAEGELRLQSPHAEACEISGVLVDLVLTDSRGIETFDRLFRIAPQIPILVLSATQDEQTARLAVQRGAQDYLLLSRVDSYSLSKAVNGMLERTANVEALFEEKERAQVTLNSIGDAVISTDVVGRITYLNTVAEGLTGWSREEATGRTFEEVFRLIDSATRTQVLNPMLTAIQEDRTVGLTPNCVLIQRDGAEAAIEDSAAPIHDRRGHVTGAVMVFHDVSRARALSLRMSYLAQHDALTELPNRVLLSDRLTQAMALAARHRQKLAVLFLDVDRFKHINDSLGHSIGDRLLQAIGRRLVTCVRSSDTVSRQGGDEFVILLSEITHGQDAAVAAEKIIVALGVPYNIDQHDLHVTVSIGIVIYPDDGADAETLLRNADFAMYHAKFSGSDNFQFFKPEMNVRAVERQSLENGLRHALDRHEFVLQYQPKVNLITGAIVSVEALIRWTHPKRGLVPPAQFIPVAEECGFIVAIGRWVLREACIQARTWQNAGLKPILVAVNISAVELRARDFLTSVRAILSETGLEPSCLELELTETFLMQDLKSTAAVLQGIKDMGIGLALDDFGTGYSSLSYLKRFPIDTLKIDRSFVKDLSTEGDDAGIVSAVISMGRSLHMRVVAEGVETHEQLTFLQGQNCEEAQGYYFSRPVSAYEIAQLLSRSEGLLPQWTTPDRLAATF